MHRRLAAALAATLFVTPLTTADPPATRTELLSNVLVTVVETSPEDLRASSLSALRELQDEDLRPLFAHFAAQKDPLLRANGIFALAEYEDPPSVNTQMLAKIQPPSQQAGLIGQAIGLGYLDDAQIDEILRWSSHTPAVEALLIATLGDRMDTPENRARIARLLEDESWRAVLVATILMIHLDGGDDRIRTLVNDLAEMEEVPRLGRLSFIFETSRRNELRGTGPLIAAIHDRFIDDERVNHDSIGTLMLLDPALAKDRWASAFEQGDSLGTRLRLAFHALSASEGLGASFFEGVPLDDKSALLSSIMAAADANARGALTDDHLRALIETSQRTSMLWAVEQTDDLPDDRALPLLMLVIEHGLEREGRPSPVNPVFVEAAARLAERDPASLIEPIARANTVYDEPATEALLAAVLRDGVELPWSPDDPPAWRNDRAEALAAIVEARLAPQTLEDAAKTERLERVALGFGSMPHLFRVQAAWMALEARGEGRRVVAQIMSETTTRSGEDPSTKGRQP